MADIDEKPPSDNPFGQLDEVAGPKPADNDNPFGHFPDAGQEIGAPQRSAGGAFGRSAVRSVLPAAGGLIGAGAGAEAGAAVGLLGGPFAPITVPAGGLVGGVLGFFGGSYAAESAQHYALKSAPDSWVDALGQSDRQQRLDAAQHPTASFLGGLLPYAMTMRPGGFARGALPENATVMQRIMANPVTKPLFGGATMGGLELAQEGYHGDVNWTNVAIATGFGVVWNKPTRLGERIHELGAAPTRALGGAVRDLDFPHRITRPPGFEEPLTVQQAGDARVIGPGVTEDVFQGTQQQDANAQMIAQQQQRDAATVTGQRPDVGANVNDVARRLDPDTFDAYDRLQQQRDTLDRWLDTYRNPSTDRLQELAAQRDAIQAEGGFLPNRGPEARRYRARLRDADAQYQAALERRQAYMEGRLEYSDEALQVQRHGMAVDEQMRDMATEVSAATRRARDAIAAGKVPEAPQPAQPVQPVPVTVPEPPAAVDLAQGRAAIIAHAFRKWVAAGRTPDEARAAAEIEADRFVTRARRFKGGLGTAAELYGREGAVVQGAGGRPIPPFTPPTAAPAATPARPAGPTATAPARAAPEAPAPAPAAAAALPARPKAFPDWEPGKEVAVGPYKQLQVVEVRPDSFVLRSPRGQLWEFTPPEKAPKDPNSLEWLAHMKEITPPRPDVEPAATDVPIPLPKAEEVELAQKDLFQSAYHGTPHKFDRFTLDHIGTGEGAQAYGWGLYFAGNKSVAKYYQEVLSATRNSSFDIISKAIRAANDGKLIGDTNDTGAIHRAASDKKLSDAEAAKQVYTQSAVMRSLDKDAPIAGPHPNLERLIKDIREDRSGRLFRVDLPDNHEFMSWDEPISQQPQALRDALPGLIERYGGELPKLISATGQLRGAIPGESVYRALAKAAGGPQAASEALRAAGIPGIRYLDQGSRVAGEGTHNYVVFDPELIKIQDYEQSAKGRIRVRPGGQSIITLMKDADASTVIHELWHDFFEQLMRDAEHPQAPPSVRDDAQSIYDALEVGGREEVKTRHHEQVAKWGEQYLREGRAPSAGLAKVFEQFKTWLTGIYETIKGLGRPINDDVRGVFDRMLAMEPGEPVIAPDRESAPTLADVQRRDAQETEPAQAEPVMDRIVAETQQAEQRLPPEVKDEVQTVFDAVEKTVNPPGEAGTGTEPAGDLGRGGGASGSEPGGGGGSEGAGGVVGGRGAARPESPSVPAGDAGQGPRATAEPPLSPTPVTQYGARESPFVHKAGNIRLENLTDSESVRQMLREVSEANEDFIGDRRGVVTDQQIDDVAAAAGMQGAERLAAARIRGQAFNAGEIMTLRKALLQSAGEVNAAMQGVAKSGSTDQDVLWYAMVRDRHQLLQGAVAQATAEWGRAGRAFRDISEQQAGGTDEYIRQATGRTLFQMREEATLGAKLDTPEKVSKFLNDAKKPGFGRMILEYWINNLISGPATHTTYMVGNMMLAINKMGPETAAAALISRARGRGAEGVQLGEVGAQFRGAARGFVPAVHASVEALRSGMTTLLPGETGRKLQFLNPGVSGTVAPPIVNEAARLSDVKASTFGVMRGMRDAFVATDGLVSAAGDPRTLPLIGTEYSALGAIPDIRVGGAVIPIGTVQRLPSRAIAAIHSFFRVMNYSIEKSALAYRAAAAEGLEGEALHARTGDLWQSPTPAIMEQARTEATDLTLMGQGSKFTQALSRLTNTEFLGFPWLKFIDPFVHISSNIIDQALIKRTPVGLLAPELRADLMGKNGAIAQDKAQARMLVGTAFAMTVGGLASQSLVSGSGPTEPHEAAMWRLAGNQAHSVRIGDFWYDTHRLGPMGMLMGVAADMYEVAHLASEGEITKSAAHLQHAITQNILDESFMRGPSDLIKAIEDPSRYGESYIRNFLSSFVPFSVGLSQEARAVDPYSREARTVVDAMRAKVPGLSMDLPPRVDIWGQPIPNRQALLSSGVTALYMQHVSTDPVNLAMVELGIHPAPVERKIRNVELTDAQHLAFAQTAGRMSKMRLDTIVQSPDWPTWNPETRRHVVTEVIRQSREVARAQVMAQDPSILQRATAAKLDKLRK